MTRKSRRIVVAAALALGAVAAAGAVSASRNVVLTKAPGVIGNRQLDASKPVFALVEFFEKMIQGNFAKPKLRMDYLVAPDVQSVIAHLKGQWGTTAT